MQRKNSETSESTNGQYQKFKDAARQLETDESEEAFERVLKKVVRAPAKQNKDEKPSDD